MSFIGERIKKYRNIKGMTQQDIADALGESSGRVIYNWEKGIGRPDCDKLARLCDLLGVSADELIGCKSMAQRPTATEWSTLQKFRALDEHGKEVVDYHVGKNVLNKISNSCRKLVEYNFSYEAEGSKIYFNLFDNIVIKEDAERPYAIAQFGEILSNAIIQKKLISITSASYDVLDNNLSKIICYAIKREQIANQS